jgi:putative transcriptional regulator
VKNWKGRSDVAIVVKLDDLLHDRRMTLTELADRVGMTLANLSILKTGKARAIRFSTLEAICEALECQPGDVLGFEDARPKRERPPASLGRAAPR